MNVILKKNLIITTLIGLLFYSLFGLLNVLAQEQQDTVALAISPQILEISANPGDTVTNEVRLDNLSDGSIKIETIAKNFTPRGEEGAVDLTEDTTSFSLAEWISVSPSTLVMPGKTSQDFTITINVPENAEPGGHFGSVVFKTVPPPNQGGDATVSQEIAPVILVEIAGEIVEEANISSFASTHDFWDSADLSANDGAVSFETRVENTGNVHFKPSGTITIRDMFGRDVTSINLDEKNVLPESIRRIETKWNDPGFAIGRYTADLTLVYGEDNTILTASTTFIILPWQTVLPVALLAVGLIYVLVRFRDRIAMAARVLTGKS